MSNRARTTKTTITRETTNLEQDNNPASASDDTKTSKWLIPIITGILVLVLGYPIVRLLSGINVTISQYNIDTKHEISSRVEIIRVGENTVYAGKDPVGYVLVDYESKRITADIWGRISESPIRFAYKAKETQIPEPSKPSTPPPVTTPPTPTPTPTPTPSPTPSPTPTPPLSKCPYIGTKVYALESRGDPVSWVQTQLKATGVWYQGDIWKVTGHVGKHTIEEVKNFMQSMGYTYHNGEIDQNVIYTLYNYLNGNVVPVQ